MLQICIRAIYIYSLFWDNGSSSAYYLPSFWATLFLAVCLELRQQLTSDSDLTLEELDFLLVSNDLLQVNGTNMCFALLYLEKNNNLLVLSDLSNQTLQKLTDPLENSFLLLYFTIIISV